MLKTTKKPGDSTENTKPVMSDNVIESQMALSGLLAQNIIVVDVDTPVNVSAVEKNTVEDVVMPVYVDTNSVETAPKTDFVQVETKQTQNAQTENVVLSGDLVQTAKQDNLNKAEFKTNNNTDVDTKQNTAETTIKDINVVDTKSDINSNTTNTNTTDAKDTQNSEKSAFEGKEVVFENADEMAKDKNTLNTTNFEFDLQTVQNYNGKDIVSVKVADKLPVENENMVEILADKITMSGKNEFDLQLEPENLGKIHIKLIFDKGETKLSIFCTNTKANELLSGHADRLAAMLENRTGNSTVVQVRQEEQQFYRQDYNGEGRNGQNQSEHNEKRKKKDENIDFINQLRLGLV